MKLNGLHTVQARCYIVQRRHIRDTALAGLVLALRGYTSYMDG